MLKIARISPCTYTCYRWTFIHCIKCFLDRKVILGCLRTIVLNAFGTQANLTLFLCKLFLCFINKIAFELQFNKESNRELSFYQVKVCVIYKTVWHLWNLLRNLNYKIQQDYFLCCWRRFFLLLLYFSSKTIKEPTLFCMCNFLGKSK